MGVAAAHHHRIGLARQVDVVGIAALAAHQLGVFGARAPAGRCRIWSAPMRLRCVLSSMSGKLVRGSSVTSRHDSQERRAGLQGCARASALLHFSTILENIAAAAWRSKGRGRRQEGLSDDERRGRGHPGLDPALDRAPQERPRWGRRSPGRHQQARGSDRGGATYAALDLGTNNCRLLVARPTGDGFRVVDAFSRIIRLGEGVTASGRLSEAAIERALDALADLPRQDEATRASRARG